MKILVILQMIKEYLGKSDSSTGISLKICGVPSSISAGELEFVQ